MDRADEQIVAHFEYVRDKTIELFNSVPDKYFGRQIEGLTETVASEFYHIARSTEWFMTTAIHDGGTETTDMILDRDGIAKLFRQSRERPRAWFEGDPARMEIETTVVFSNGPTHTYTGREWLLTTIDHEVNHRGRLTLALRQMGFTGFPAYRYS